MKLKRIGKGMLLALAMLAVVSLPVLAQDYYADVTVLETTGNDYGMFPSLKPLNVTNFVDSNFITSTGLDTRVLDGADELPHMLSNNKLLFAHALPALSSQTYQFTTGNSALPSFDIITGYGGHVTIADDADLELGDDFEIEVDGYVDISSGSNKNLVHKGGAFRTYVNAAESIRAAVLTTTAPTVAATNGGTNAADTTNHTVNLPSGISAGHMLLAFFASDGNPTITFPNEGTDWIQLFETVSATNVTFGAWYRIADGGEGASIAVTTSASEKSAYTTYRITGYVGVPEASTPATGSSTNPDPSSLTPSWDEGNTLWFVAQGNDDRETVSAYPSNYAFGRNDTVDAADGCGVGTARRVLEASSEDPGTFTLTGTQEWVAATIAVRYVETETAKVTATGISSGDMTVKTVLAAGLSFDGGNDKLTVTDDPTLDIEDAISIEMWIKFDTVNFSAADTILGKGGRGGATSSYQFYTDTENDLWFGAALAPGPVWTSGEIILDVVQDTWYHLVAVYDGANFIGYVDGSVDQTVPKTGAMAANNDDIVVASQGASFLDADIALIRIYDDALTPTEVASNFNGNVTTDGLVSQWLLNDGATATDSVGPNNGTIDGASWITAFLALYVDDTLEQLVDALGVTVPDNANDWILFDNSTTQFLPYMDYFKITVDGSEVLWYQPNEIISGTTLPDRQAAGGSENGTITWGSNPTGVSVLMDSLTSYDEGIAVSGEAALPGAGAEIGEPEDMFPTEGEMSGSNIQWLYGTIYDVANLTDTPIAVFWGFLCIGLVMYVFVAVFRYTQNMLMAGVMMLVMIGACVGMSLLPVWVVIIPVFIVLAFVLMERKPAV